MREITGMAMLAVVVAALVGIVYSWSKPTTESKWPDGRVLGNPIPTKLNKRHYRRKPTRTVLKNKHMTPDAVALLQQNVGKVVRLTRPDGEVIIAKITLVDPLDEEIVFDMLSTTDESKYEKFDRAPAYLLYFNDISTVTAMTNSTS